MDIKFGRKNAFKPLTPQEKANKTAFDKKIQDEISSVRELAAACLKDGRFAQYRDEFKRSREALIQVFLSVDEDTIEKEWKKFKQIQNELNILGTLLESVERDAEVKKD